MDGWLVETYINDNMTRIREEIEEMTISRESENYDLNKFHLTPLTFLCEPYLNKNKEI